jgi:hypothetical protein
MPAEAPSPQIDCFANLLEPPPPQPTVPSIHHVIDQTQTFLPYTTKLFFNAAFGEQTPVPGNFARQVNKQNPLCVS